MPSTFPSPAGLVDMFSRSTEDYRHGYADVWAGRTDDHARRCTLFTLTFIRNGGFQSRRGPDRIMLDTLLILRDMMSSGRSFIDNYQDRGHEAEYRIVVSDMDYLEWHLRGRGRSLYNDPNLVMPPSPPIKIQFTPPEKPKPKKIYTVKKIQREPVTGFRDFAYLKKGNHSRPMLMSRNGVPWPRYQALVASCNGDPFVAHDAPSVGCQCGIYAFTKPDHPELKKDANIWGEIALWGKVLVCPHGYRAEFAYPQNIFIKDVGTKTVRKFRDDIEREYGVPVHLVKEREGKTTSEVMQQMIDDFVKAVTK